MARKPSRRNSDRQARPNILGFRAPRDLATRREVVVELPEFLILLIERRAAEASDGAGDDERITVSNVVEYQLADMLSIREVAELELDIPGFTAAVEAWLATSRA
jgi:hypothetical protein